MKYESNNGNLLSFPLRKQASEVFHVKTKHSKQILYFMLMELFADTLVIRPTLTEFMMPSVFIKKTNESKGNKAIICSLQVSLKRL